MRGSRDTDGCWRNPYTRSWMRKLGSRDTNSSSGLTKALPLRSVVNLPLPPLKRREYMHAPVSRAMPATTPMTIPAIVVVDIAGPVSAAVDVIVKCEEMEVKG